jgi:type IV pilus assembly protein PilW
MSQHIPYFRPADAQKGFTMIELMISLVLGLFVISVVITVFVQSKRNFNQDEQIARMQENGRYALLLLSREVAHAGFLGGMSAVDSVTTSETFSDSCADWFNPLAKPVEIMTAATASSKTCFSGETISSGTPVMAIKRTVGKSTTTPEANKLYFRTSGQGGTIIKTAAAGTSPGGFEDWEYTVEIYYIKGDDSDGDGTVLPGLFRKRLVVTGGAISVTDDGLMVPGINNFGVQYGIDTSGDGIANQYQIASGFAGDLSKVVSSRVSVLASSTKEDYSNTNNKNYSLYPNAVATASVSGLTGTGYYGRVFVTTTQTRNMAYRIQLSNLSK